MCSWGNNDQTLFEQRKYFDEFRWVFKKLQAKTLKFLLLSKEGLSSISVLTKLALFSEISLNETRQTEIPKSYSNTGTKENLTWVFAIVEFFFKADSNKKNKCLLSKTIYNNKRHIFKRRSYIKPRKTKALYSDHWKYRLNTEIQNWDLRN